MAQEGITGWGMEIGLTGFIYSFKKLYQMSTMCIIPGAGHAHKTN